MAICLKGEASCSSANVANVAGWEALTVRQAAEQTAQVRFLEIKNIQATDLHATLLEHRADTKSLRQRLEDAIEGTKTSTKMAEAARKRIEEMGGAVKSAEQLQLAKTRRTIVALEKATARYQADLDEVQPSYGDVAGRHQAYRQTETAVFTNLTQLATQASTAGLEDLPTLKISLGNYSNSENHNPQLLIADARNVRWQLANLQATYEHALAPHMEYLTEKNIPVLNHTGAPRTGMDNVIAYANNRIDRVNEAVRAIYDGIRLRESALVLNAADAATRDQLRAAEAAQREANFLDDITAQVAELWKAPPISALSLALQGERLRLMTAFLQLEGACSELTAAATWRGPGCQRVAAEASKVRTYLTQTLPFTLRFGVNKMRTAGYDEAILTQIDAKRVAGQLVEAVHMYDATLRAAEEG